MGWDNIKLQQGDMQQEYDQNLLLEKWEMVT